VALDGLATAGGLAALICRRVHPIQTMQHLPVRTTLPAAKATTPPAVEPDKGEVEIP
jgi:hypothetical protein